MAFGQPAGPPASQRQIQELADLFQRAGFDSFREARHPYGLNQRQAGGRFTVEEAEELIERLTAAETVQLAAAEGAPEAALGGGDAPPADAPAEGAVRRPDPAPPRPSERRAERRAELLGTFGDRLLAEELERRGWCCIPPIGSGD